jgi:superfamily I DNA/RNA helicase
MGSPEHAVGTLDGIGQQDHSTTCEYRIFGPPGAGKTTNLTRQIRRAVEKFGTDAVLVTSFSRAAAAELTGRDLPVRSDRIGTLHSHCWHALGGPEVAEANVHEWNRANPHLAITPARKQGKLDGEESIEEEGDTGKDGDRLLQQLNRYRGLMLDRALWPPMLRDFEKKWTEHKRALGLLDFADLIETCLRDVAAPKNPAVIFADEAQDLNKMQLTLIRKWGERANYFILAGDDDQCQPPGTMVRTSGGDVPIEALDPERHSLLVYSPAEGRIYGTQGRRYRFRKACRPYDWLLLAIHAGSACTHCTPDHRFLVRWVKSEMLHRAHVVYLMRQGKRFRVGWCKLIRSDGVFHLGHRARLERADAAWVLKLLFDRTEASIYESFVAAKYGLPLATFEPINGATHYTEESLQRLFEMLKDDLPLRAVQCLLDHHRDPRFPLYTPERAAAKRGGSTTFISEAANLLPCLMAVPVPNCHNRVDWVPISVEAGHYQGQVYSLEVEKYHTYIADGIATHNCIYGWTGATPDAMLDPDIPEDHKIILKQSYRVPRAVHCLADRLIRQVTRRQEKIYLPRPADGKVERLSRDSYKSPEFFIVPSALEHLERGKTVMFLVACSYMLHPVVAVLRKQGIPFHNPYRKANGFWNPLRFGKRSSSVNRLLALLSAQGSCEQSRRPWTYGEVSLWAECLRSKGILLEGAKKKLQGYDADKLVALEALGELFELAAIEPLLAAYEGDCHALIGWWQERLTADVRRRVQYPAEIVRRRGPQALLKAPQVVVGTIHSVKGGQADVVYLFPDLSQAGDAQYQRFGPPRDSVIRLFYVGATRARETLYVCQRAAALAASI